MLISFVVNIDKRVANDVTFRETVRTLALGSPPSLTQMTEVWVSCPYTADKTPPPTPKKKKKN